MSGFLNKYIAVFLTGFVVSYLLTPVVRWLAVRFGIVDLPNERRPHKRATARGGGLAIFLGFHAACLMAVAFPWPKFAGGLDFAWWQRFVLPSLVLLIIGLIDDIRGMRPLVKLGGQAIAASLIFLGGARFGILLGHQLPLWLDFVMVNLWILAVINAFNLVDGLDGLASGLAIISALGLCGVVALDHLPANVLVLLGFIAACLAFLRYNFHPASVFLGDTGSMFIGFTLGVVSLQTFNKNTFILSLTIPMLVLGVPIYDTLLAIWRRSVRKWLNGGQLTVGRKLPGIMQPDLEHLHHRLLKAGLSTRRVATVLCVGNAALVIFGLLITTFRSHAAGIFLIALLAGAYVLTRHLAILELRDTGTALLRGFRRPSPTTLRALGFPAWDMFWMVAAVAVSMWLSGGYSSRFWHDWFLDLPVWVTPTFCVLAVSRTYVTVWSRARMRDVLALVVELETGLLFSLGLALLIDPYNRPEHLLVRALVVATVGHPGILGLRMLYRCVEELVSWTRSKDAVKPDGKRVVLYGAGGRCWLFFRELELHHLGCGDGREIVGLIDDDASLHFLWVYGYQVLGGRKDLPELISQYGLTGIVVTALLTPESRAAIQELALQHGLDLSEWRCEECEVDVTLRPKVIPFDNLNSAGAGDPFQKVSAANNPATPHGR
jgi:UDP-N-acetylmuramyl pentapeptide phosphotransferase/UDP-N-acetylglucosamine-1-phosphate transferase